MPAYYFAMEGYTVGEKPDPAVDTLITIQYQKIDLTSGEPLGELTILKEWESSEKEIVTTFYNQFFRPEMPVTQFIPVGMNLDYEYEQIIAKFKKYNLPTLTSYQLYYQRPRFDLRSIIVLLNDGRFPGATLDSFSSKKYDGSHVKKWFDKNEFKQIEHYIREDAEAFLKLLQYLSKYKTRLGIAKKEEPTRQKRTQPTPPGRKDQKFHPHPKTQGAAIQAENKPADARTPAPKKSSARIAKAPSKRSSQKSLSRKTSVPLNQFSKYMPTKKSAEKRR